MTAKLLSLTNNDYSKLSDKIRKNRNFSEMIGLSLNKKNGWEVQMAESKEFKSGNKKKDIDKEVFELQAGSGTQFSNKAVADW